MGQYFVLVNLDRKEFVHPYSLGLGLKWQEQKCRAYSMADVMWVFMTETNDMSFNCCNVPNVGRWAGERVVLLGDYAEGPFVVGCTEHSNGPETISLNNLLKKVKLKPTVESDFKSVGKEARASLEALSKDYGDEIRFVRKGEADLLPDEYRAITIYEFEKRQAQEEVEVLKKRVKELEDNAAHFVQQALASQAEKMEKIKQILSE